MNLILIWVISCRLLQVSVAAKKGDRIPNYAGPFKLVVKSVEDCPEEMLGKHALTITGVAKRTRQFPEPRFDGILQYFVNLDDSLMGNFTLRSLPLTHSVAQDPDAFPYGRWRGDMHYTRSNEKVACIRVFVDTVPDYGKSKGHRNTNS